MDEKEDKGFRVVDKRHTASPDEESSSPKAEETRGEDFLMKDSPQEDSSASPISQIDFSTFIYSLATGALIHLGLAPDPVTKQVAQDLPLAKQDIDLLEIMQQKTKGNLTKDEEQLLTALLTEVRLKYVEATQTDSN